MIQIFFVALLLVASNIAMAADEMPEFLKESAEIARNLSGPVSSSRKWLDSIRTRGLNLSYDEGGRIDIAVALLRIDIDKMEERAAAFHDPATRRLRLSLLVHITSDVYRVRYGLREIQTFLENCLTCDSDGLKQAAKWAAAADSILQSLEETADSMRRSSAGAVHEVSKQLEICQETGKPPNIALP